MKSQMDRQGDESDEQQRDGDELMWEKERDSILNVQPGGVTEVWARKEEVGMREITPGVKSSSKTKNQWNGRRRKEGKG